MNIYFMQNQASLKQKLEDISKVFKIEDVLNIEANKEYIQRYYNINKIPYSLFHTKTDFVHMGISRDGVYKEDDLFEAARVVEKYIKNRKVNKVLELAAGRGASLFYLAKRFSEVLFYGIDISKGQLDYAFEKVKNGGGNYHPDFGDYHDLSKFGNETFDIVFVIEALCHSTDKNKVLAEVWRVLKTDGIFIIIDGYSNKSQMTEDEKTALLLVVKGMALESFEYYNNVVSKARKNKFKVEFDEDVSKFVLPTMEWFERKAAKFFRFSILAKLTAKIFPKEFLYNAIAGYLSATLVETGICSYMITVFKKE